jgi:hypothetical protein
MKKRCANCHKSSMIHFDCKCNKVLCINCRQYSTHDCTYDWRSATKDRLTQVLIKIEPSKVAKI